MVIDKDDDGEDLTLHEKLKAAHKELRQATDDLEANRLVHRDDPSDRNRMRVWQAKMKLLEATEFRDELLDEISDEGNDPGSGWPL